MGIVALMIFARSGLTGRATGGAEDTGCGAEDSGEGVASRSSALEEQRTTSTTTTTSKETSTKERPTAKQYGYESKVTCSDRSRTWAESDVDCGGSECEPCADSRLCQAHEDCSSKNCQGQRCLPTDCAVEGRLADLNIKLKGACGCMEDSDCGNGLCDRRDCGRFDTSCRGVCIDASCHDGTLDGTETDVDCGGSCTPCINGKTCKVDGDCLSGKCDSGQCAGQGPMGSTCNSDDDCLQGKCQAAGKGAIKTCNCSHVGKYTAANPCTQNSDCECPGTHWYCETNLGVCASIFPNQSIPSGCTCNSLTHKIYCPVYANIYTWCSNCCGY